MTHADDLLARRLEELGDPALPDAIGTRTLVRAAAWLEQSDGPRDAWWSVVGHAAVPALLVSAAAVFAADAYGKILQAFGG
jgi:hypothetical protein